MTTTTRSRAILATASRLFAEKGYSQTPTAEIAREAFSDRGGDASESPQETPQPRPRAGSVPSV